MHHEFQSNLDGSLSRRCNANSIKIPSHTALAFIIGKSACRHLAMDSQFGTFDLGPAPKTPSSSEQQSVQNQPEGVSQIIDCQILMCDREQRARREDINHGRMKAAKNAFDKHSEASSDAFAFENHLILEEEDILKSSTETSQEDRPMFTLKARRIKSFSTSILEKSNCLDHHCEKPSDPCKVTPTSSEARFIHFFYACHAPSPTPPERLDLPRYAACDERLLICSPPSDILADDNRRSDLHDITYDLPRNDSPEDETGDEGVNFPRVKLLPRFSLNGYAFRDISLANFWLQT